MPKQPEDKIEDDGDSAEAPLTMAASIVLTNLPKDTSKALESAGPELPEKGASTILPARVNSPHVPLLEVFHFHTMYFSKVSGHFLFPALSLFHTTSSCNNHFTTLSPQCAIHPTQRRAQEFHPLLLLHQKCPHLRPIYSQPCHHSLLRPPPQWLSLIVTSNNPFPPHWQRPTPRATRLQSQDLGALRHGRAFCAETARRQGERERVSLYWECVQPRA
jgi:hypothetical protein